MYVVRNATVVALAAALAVMLSACGDKKSAADNAAKEIVQVGVSDAGCSPGVLNLTAGPKQFEIKATGSGKVTEYEILDGKKIIAERESLTPGVDGEFEINLRPGEYTSYCPGGKHDKGQVIVAAAAATSATGASTTSDTSPTGVTEPESSK